MRTFAAGACVALAIAGCAANPTTGTPALRVENPDGTAVLYYPQSPMGRHTYAVTVDKSGAVRGTEQRLTLANYNKLVVGKTTKKEASELLGPPSPHATTRLALTGREVWEYPWLDYQEKRIFWLQFSEDGILRETMNVRDDWNESPGAAMP